MAETKITDVKFASEIFASTFRAAFTNKLELLNSGVLLNLPEELVSSNSTGYTVAVPRWNVLSGDADKIVDGLTTTINGLTDFKDVAAWMEREKAWGADEMVKVISGKDATQEIARMLGEYWANQLHKSAVNHLTGVFTTSLASTHVYNATATTDKLISKENVLRVKGKLGDSAPYLTNVLMNSSIYLDAIRNQLITDGGYTDAISQTGKIEMLLGSKTFQTDTLEATAGVYPTYFAAQGAMGFKFRNRGKNTQSNQNFFTISVGGIIIDVELYRNSISNGGIDALISRVSYLTHVPGVQFDGTVASNPSDTELATGTTWTKVQTDNKLIPIVQLLTETTTLA
jgi:hypothetical protein